VKLPLTNTVLYWEQNQRQIASGRSTKKPLFRVLEVSPSSPRPGSCFYMPQVVFLAAICTHHLYCKLIVKKEAHSSLNPHAANKNKTVVESWQRCARLLSRCNLQCMRACLPATLASAAVKAHPTRLVPRQSSVQVTRPPSLRSSPHSLWPPATVGRSRISSSQASLAPPGSKSDTRCTH
jgi:hypothetical protein